MPCLAVWEVERSGTEPFGDVCLRDPVHHCQKATFWLSVRSAGYALTLRSQVSRAKLTATSTAMPRNGPKRVLQVAMVPYGRYEAPGVAHQSCALLSDTGTG